MKIKSSIVFVSALMLAGNAFADERALQQALAKAQFMLKQTAAEKLSAEQELEKVKGEFTKYRKTSENQLQEKEQGATRLAGNVNLLKERYIQLTEKYQQLQQGYKDAVNAGREAESKLDHEQKNFQLCYDNNRKLFDINQEILGNYENKGVWEVLQEKEPFTGYQTVKLETLIQDYQYKNEDLKLDDSLLGATSLNPN